MLSWRPIMLALLVGAPIVAAAQPQEILFPGLEGAELLEAIVAAYKPATVLPEAEAKDRMYDTIDITSGGGQDGVVGVYTGWFVPFDCSPSCDPSQDIFNDGAGLNMEHTWPRAFGADEGNAQWDLHHLFPTRVVVNAARGNLEFLESPDPETTTWFWEDESQSSVPPPDVIDEYSELRSGVAFEPREDHKGDAARAVYYFYTMYQDQADAAGGGPFFLAQKATLFDWSYLDPVSQREHDRTFAIAPFQTDRPNPFVLDSTLIRRAYFPDIVVGTGESASPARPLISKALPNPFRSRTRFVVTPSVSGPVRLDVLDALGRPIVRLYDGHLEASARLFDFDGEGLSPGVYVLRLRTRDRVFSRLVVRVR